MSDPIRNFVIIIPGFTQNVGGDIGANKMWKHLHREFHDDFTAVLAPIAWHQPMDHWAGFVHSMIEDADDPCIMIAGYSYGCGWGFQKISKYLEDWAINVRCAVLCDPVYRSPFYSLAWRSMITKDVPIVGWMAPTIRVRKNVREVHSFYQLENRPRAHRLVAMDPNRTTIHPRERLFKPHQAMDDHPDFHHKVHEVFGAILEERR